MRCGLIFVGVATLGMLLSGCTQPTHDQRTLEAVKVEASTLLQANQASGDVPIVKERWPRAIASLNPQSVTVSSDGIDILVRPAADGGYGYFVSRNGYSLPNPAQRYSALADGIYWYRPH